MKIVCVIPSTCTKPVLKQCLRSLEKAKTKNIHLFQIIATSNEKALEMNLKVKKIIIINKSCGFAEMVNEAINQAFLLFKPDYFLIINDDAWIHKDFIKIFKSLCRKENFDVYTPIIYKPDKKTIDSFGDEYFTSGFAKQSNVLTAKTELTSFACVIVKSEFIRKILITYGYVLNPLLHFYMEDVEFSIRARAIGGTFGKFTNLVAYHIRFHTTGRESFFKVYHVYRNSLWVIILTWPILNIFKRIHSILAVLILAGFYATYKFGPWFTISTIISTIYNLSLLLKYRKKALNSYKKNFDFSIIFSKYAFRFRNGLTIKI